MNKLRSSPIVLFAPIAPLMVLRMQIMEEKY